jgi:hypothetical protein
MYFNNIDKETLIAYMKGSRNLTGEVGALVIDIEDYDEPEIIVVLKENVNKKIEYIEKTYDSDLKHKYSDKDIEIVSFITLNKNMINRSLNN